MPLGPRPNYVPSAEASALGTRLAGGLQAPRPNRISLKDDRFTLITESGQVHPTVPPALSIQAIIVGSNSHASRVFYDSDSFDADNPDAPVCWSDNGVGPSDKSAAPQSPTCAQCPKSVWGSAISKMTGKGIPACQGRKKIALLVAGAGNDPYLLDIPGGSTKAFGLYIAHIGNELHAAPEGIVTTITMVNKELAFTDAMWVPENMMAGVKQIVEGEAVNLVVNEHDRRVQARLTAPLTPHGQSQLTQPSTEMQSDPFARMYPKGPQHDERNPPPPDMTTTLSPEQAALVAAAAQQQQFDAPMTSQQAEAVNSGQPAPARKPRSDKGVSRKAETVVGPGPIPAQTFTPQLNPNPQLNTAASFGGPPNGGFIGGHAAPTQPQFGMVAEPQAPTAALDAMLDKAFGGLKFGQ